MQARASFLGGCPPFVAAPSLAPKLGHQGPRLSWAFFPRHECEIFAIVTLEGNDKSAVHPFSTLLGLELLTLLYVSASNQKNGRRAIASVGLTNPLILSRPLPNSQSQPSFSRMEDSVRFRSIRVHVPLHPLPLSAFLWEIKKPSASRSNSVIHAMSEGSE